MARSRRVLEYEAPIEVKNKTELSFFGLNCRRVTVRACLLLNLDEGEYDHIPNAYSGLSWTKKQQVASMLLSS